jgi:hypothetical protein
MKAGGSSAGHEFHFCLIMKANRSYAHGNVKTFLNGTSFEITF